MNHLTSPGRALVKRQQIEHELGVLTVNELGMMLSQVRADVRGALQAPVLLAAGAKHSNEPFTLGSVLGAWANVVEVIKVWLGKTGPSDAFLAAVVQRLANSALPAVIYDSARAVLTTSVEKGWDATATREALNAALSIDTASTAVTVDGLVPSGTSWKAIAERIARTEATAVAAHTALNDLAAFGYAEKRWVAHHDEFTRADHLAADGQVVPTASTFSVGGYAMMAPGDPSAPLMQTVNCRCSVVAVTR